MFKKLKGLVLVGCLALAAPSAFAVSFGVSIYSLGSAGSGTWSLTGPTAIGPVNWSVPGTYSSGGDIGPGSYNWSISGSAYNLGIGGIGWTLSLGGQQIYKGSDWGFVFVNVRDSTDFDVGAVSVPEPGTLALLGLGLLGIGWSARRKGSEA